MRCIPFALAGALTACHGPPAADPDLDRAAALALVLAAPGDWPTHGRAALARGRELSPFLVDALAERPSAPGAQLAVAVLGDLGHEGSIPCLERIAGGGSEAAYEAALALGRMRAVSSRNLLVSLVRDPSRSVTVRAAAACALFELGDFDASHRFLRAVLLGGTPAGRELAVSFQIPDRSRWALERELAIEAIRRVTGQDFGLDPDSPWPALEAGADRFRDHMAAVRR